jgi:HEAT repeat protein
LRPLRTASPFALALVGALGLIGTSEAVDPLLSVVRDPGADIGLRVAAAEAAASTGDEFVAPVLLDLVAGASNPRDPTAPWLRTRLLRPLVRVIDAERAAELRALPHDPRMFDSDAQAQVAVAETCKADLDCYVRLLDDPSPARAEKAAWAVGFSGDRTRAPALLKRLVPISDLPAAQYEVYSAALMGLTRLADQRCQACRDKLRAQIEVDGKLVHEPREKELLRQTRLALAYLDHKAPPVAPAPTARR